MLTGIIIGLLAGIVAGGLILFLASPSMMLRENSYPGDFESATANLERVIESKGWKIPHVHDLQATMEKFGKEVKSVKVFEICKPEYSYQILSRSRERIVSSLMPCRISVYEKEDGSVWISRMNSGLVAKPMSRVIRKAMTAATEDMEEVITEVLKD